MKDSEQQKKAIVKKSYSELAKKTQKLAE